MDGFESQLSIRNILARFKEGRKGMILLAVATAAFMLIFSVSGLMAQGRTTVTGTVVDASDNDPLIGVNIVVLGSQAATGSIIGTTTNADGSYSISVPAGLNTLSFSFVGYQTQEVAINGRTRIDVALAQDMSMIEAVVVVGYGTQRERNLTGSISATSSEDFNRGAMMSPQQLIQGKMAGVNISQNSGKPGGSNTVLIRGGTSLTGSNEPLYVIDGVPISTSSSLRQVNINSGGNQTYFDQEPINPLNSINPADIESITILKDASATAIYGSRGANGVIVITTKAGRPGTIQSSYDTRFGFSRVAGTLDVLSADEFRAANQSLGLAFIDMGGNLNYQDQIFRSAYSQNHDLSFSGGTHSTSYRASVGYGQTDGIVIGSNMENTNARLNVNHSAMDGRLKFDFRVSSAFINSSTAPTSNIVSGEAGTNVIWEAYRFNPTVPVYDANNNFNHISQFNVNPVSYSKQLEDEQRTRRILGNMSTTYDIIDNLSVNLNLGYTYQNSERNAYIQRASPLGGGFGGQANILQTSDWNKLMETTFRYVYNIGGKHDFDVIAGYSYQYFVDEGFRVRASGFISDVFRWNSLQAASNIESVTSFKESNTLISYYTRLNYGYLDKYLVTATLRRDGSSRFGDGNKWGVFPSASVAWRISDEQFLRGVSFIDDLKLRASYGITGNQEIGNLNAISTLSASAQGYMIGGTRRTIVLPSQYANPDLKWEETTQTNLAVDFELFNGYLYGKTEYYVKETNDLLLTFAVPSPSVVNTQIANVGSVQNKGFEIELGSRIINTRDLLWKVDFNLSANRNKVLSLSDDTWATDNIQIGQVRGTGLTGVFAQRITPGKPIGTFYGREFRGIENGAEVLGTEIVEIGNAQPDFIYGLSSSVFYKRFDFTVNFRGSQGNDILNLTALNMSYLSNLPAFNVLSSAVDAGVARNQPKVYSSRWIEDGSFFRLDNLTLGYNVDTSRINFLNSARVFMNAQNLFVITKYSGIDPEVNSDISGTGSTPLGIDYLSYPRSRTFSIGASLSF